MDNSVSLIDNIYVFDNFLSQSEIKKANEIIKTKNWCWGHESNGTERYETPFWSTTLMDEDFFTKEIKEIIEKQVFKKLELDRVYANGSTFGQDGAFHTDTEEENCYTFVLYLCNISKNYIETAGGHIVFKLPDLKYKIAYEPIYNRGIFFPSNYIHRSTSFCRYVMDLRISVAWKLREIK